MHGLDWDEEDSGRTTGKAVRVRVNTSMCLTMQLRELKCRRIQSTTARSYSVNDQPDHIKVV